MTHLLEHAGAYFKLDPRLLVSPARQRPIAYARQICCYVLRKRFGMSYPLIGKLMHRDHSTIIHAVEKVWYAVETDMTMAAAIEHLMQVPCSRFIPAWHKQAATKVWGDYRKKPDPTSQAPDASQYVMLPRAGVTVPVVAAPTGKAKNDFDTGDDPESKEATFRAGIRQGSADLIEALRAV